MTKYEKLSLVMSTAALIVSLGSVWLHYQTTKSIVHAYVYPAQLGTLRFNSCESKLKNGYVCFRHRFCCILRNTSTVDSTILSASLLAFEKDTNTLHYSCFRLDEKFIDTEGKPVDFPFRLKPKDAKIIYIEITIPIPKEVWNRVNGKIELDTDIKFFEVWQIFKEAGIPWFGQVDCPEKNTVGRYRTSKHFINYSVSFLNEDMKEVEAKFDVTGAHDIDDQDAILLP